MHLRVFVTSGPASSRPELDSSRGGPASVMDPARPTCAVAGAPFTGSRGEATSPARRREPRGATRDARALPEQPSAAVRRWSASPSSEVRVVEQVQAGTVVVGVDGSEAGVQIAMVPVTVVP